MMKIVIVIMFCFFSILSKASGDQKTIGLFLRAGVPDLIGLDLSYVGFEKFHIGFGYGTFNVQSFIDKYAKIPQARIDDSFAINSRLYGSMDSFGLFTKFFPFGKVFYTELGFSKLNVRVDFAGDLVNTSLNTTFPNALGGSAELSQNIIYLRPGIDIRIVYDLHLLFSLGVGFLQTPKGNIYIGGTATSILPLLPGGQEALDSAITEIKKSYDDALNDFHNTTKIIPTTMLSIAWYF